MLQSALRVSIASVLVTAAVGCRASLAAGPAPKPAAAGAHDARSAPVSPRPAAQLLAFSELIASDGELGPSAAAQRLSGTRVRMVGFMAHLEIAPRGAFYLTSQPVVCDEAGGGTADLPLDSVWVAVPSLSNTELRHIDGAVEVVGRFEVGNRVDDGFASNFRIHMDLPAHELASGR
jgi:hypothetical protein